MRRARQFKSDPDWMSLKEAVFIIKGYDEGEPNMVDRQVDSERYTIARRKLFAKACEAIGRGYSVSNYWFPASRESHWKNTGCYQCGKIECCHLGLRETEPHVWRSVFLCRTCSTQRSLPIETEWHEPIPLHQCGQLTPRQMEKRRRLS